LFPDEIVFEPAKS